MGLFKRLFKSDSEKHAIESRQELSTNTMHTLSHELVVEPFGKVNYWNLPNGGKRLRVYLLMESSVEGAQTGVAIDGSGSMMHSFGKEAVLPVRQLTQREWQELITRKLALRKGAGVELVDHPKTLPTLVSFGAFRQLPAGPNIVEEQARKMTEYLSRFDADGDTTAIYWATGNDGRQIEVIGDLRREDCSAFPFPGPKNFGRETHLLPALRYFVERFENANWGIYVFITDGAISDLDAVKRYCIRLARDIAAKKRNELKFVLIGVGDKINEAQMEELDDLETGTNVDLWDHKIAREMKQLAEIFAEVVSETTVVVPGDGIVKDAKGNVVKDYRDTGLPALVVFELPAGSGWFTLEIAGKRISQPLVPGVKPTPL